MRKRPAAAFVAKVMAALPANGAPLSARGVWIAIGHISTPGYVRIVLRDLAVSGCVIGTGPAQARVYRRIQNRHSVACVPAGGVPVVQGDTVHECA
jgi:hypothetical protein